MNVKLKNFVIYNLSSLIFFLMISSAYCYGPPGYLPDGPHPRLMLTNEILTRLTALHQSGQDTQWDRLVYDLTGDKASGATNYGSSEKQPHLLALLWHITGDTQYRNAAINNLIAGVNHYDSAFRSMTTSDQWRWSSERFFYAFDWIYDELTPSQRTSIANSFAAWATRAKDFGYKHDDPGNNYFGAHYRGCAMVGVVTYGENITDSSALQPLEILGWALEGGGGYDLLKSVMDLNGGSYNRGIFPEGPEYTPQTIGYIFQGWDAIFTGTGRNLWTTTPFKEWTDEHARHQLYDVLPGGISYPRNDWLNGQHDVDSTKVGTSLVSSLSTLQRYKTGPLKAYIRHLLDTFTPTLYNWFSPGDKGLHFFAADRETTATDYTKELPLDFFNGNSMGQVYGRHGWGSDDIIWGFIAGWRGTDHMHAESGSFLIRKDGEWVVGHEIGWAYEWDEPEAHNVFAIQTTHPYSRWTKANLSPDNWSLYQQFGWPDNGKESNVLLKDLPDLKYGVSDGEYTYVEGDLTNHYWHKEYQWNVSKPINGYWRSFIDLKDGTFVVSDKYDIEHCLDYNEWNSNPNQSKNCYRAFQFHFLKTSTPSISTNSISYNTVKSDVKVTAVTHGNRTWTYDHEYNIHGNSSDFPHYYIGQIKGDDSLKREHMITVFDIRDRGATAKTVSEISATNMVGALIGNKAVLFNGSYSNTPIATTRYTVNATEHLITGLMPNVPVIVTRGGVELADSPINSGPEGIVHFTYTAGNASYTVTAGTPDCTSDPSLCLNQSACVSASWNWCTDGSVCQSEVCSTPPVNDCTTDPTLCSSQSTCESGGWNWCTDTCQSATCPPVNDCTTDPTLCSSQSTCESGGWNWCTDTCQTASCPQGDDDGDGFTLEILSIGPGGSK